MINFSEIFDNLKTNVSDFFKEKKIVAIITTVLVTLFLLALIIFIVQQSNKPKVQILQEEQPLVQDQKLILPESASSESQYAFSREPQEKWTKEEAQKYFTFPTQDEIEKLQSANDNLVDQILGSVP